MTAYVFKRLQAAVPVFLLICFFSFLPAYLIPGSPVVPDAWYPEVSQQQKETNQQRFHLDKSLFTLAPRLVGDLLTGKLVSSSNKQSIRRELFSRLPTTLALVFMALLLTIAFACPLGIIAARHAHNPLGSLMNVFLFILNAAPTFWVAYLVILGFVRIETPMLGTKTFGIDWQSPVTELLNRMWHLFVPAAILALPCIGHMAREIRRALHRQEGMAMVLAIRAKGLSYGKTFYRHCLRIALIPAIGSIKRLVPFLLGTTILIESIFIFPGLGQLAFDAVHQHNYAVIMILNLVFASLVLTSRILSDILLGFADPTILTKRDS